jgi:hypothetical protein
MWYVVSRSNNMLEYIIPNVKESFRNISNRLKVSKVSRDRRGRDRMVVGFTPTNAISAYRHYRCEFEPCS